LWHFWLVVVATSQLGGLRFRRLSQERKDSKRRIDATVAAVMAHNPAAVLAGDRGPSIHV
jgi:hypothetical protein